MLKCSLTSRLSSLLYVTSAFIAVVTPLRTHTSSDADAFNPQPYSFLASPPLSPFNPRPLPLHPQLTLRVKALKRQVDESELEVERLEGVRRKVLRDLEEQRELQEALQAKVTTLESELK